MGVGRGLCWMKFVIVPERLLGNILSLAESLSDFSTALCRIVVACFGVVVVAMYT